MAVSGKLAIYVDNKAEDVPRLLECKVKVNAKSGLVFVMRPELKKTVVVAMHGEQTLAWYSNGKTDCPTWPTDAIMPEKAIQDVREGSTIAGELTPIRLKSQWAGSCVLNAEGFVVSLLRKPNNYTVLELESDPKRGGWNVRVHRLTNWHSSSKTHEEFQPFLKDAVAAVERAALPIIGEACAVKELYRRGALDVAYGEAKPIKPAAVPKNRPTTGFWAEAEKRAVANEKAAQKAGEKASKKAPKTDTKVSKSETNAPKAAAAAPASTLPASVPSTAPPVRRRVMTPTKVAEPEPGVTPEAYAGEIDPAMDKLLMDAVGSAITQALASMN